MTQYHSSREFTFKYPCEDKTNCHGIEFSLSPGQYLLEVFGASSGFFSGYEESRGGYSRGVLYLNESVSVFIFIGSSGVVKNTGSGFTNQAFNGGGRGRKINEHVFVSSGGGSTDIRLFSPDLSKRVIVAGGSGGHGHYSIHSKGGFGGGEYGGEGEKGYDGQSYYNGGTGGGPTDQNHFLFGRGEDFSDGTFNACGGGGGWFGGKAGIANAAGGGGGSGFVFTESNPYSTLPFDYFLKDASTFSGNSQYGHLGNGMARIIVLESNIPSIFHCYKYPISLISVIFSLIISNQY